MLVTSQQTIVLSHKKQYLNRPKSVSVKSKQCGHLAPCLCYWPAIRMHLLLTPFRWLSLRSPTSAIVPWNKHKQQPQFQSTLH